MIEIENLLDAEDKKIVIIAVLAAILIPTLTGYIEKTKLPVPQR